MKIVGNGYAYAFVCLFFEACVSLAKEETMDGAVCAHRHSLRTIRAWTVRSVRACNRDVTSIVCLCASTVSCDNLGGEHFTLLEVNKRNLLRKSFFNLM